MLTFSSLSSAITQPDWKWAQQHGGTSSGVTTRDITVDAEGNSYVIGDFSGTASFGSYALTSAGNRDSFLAKIDAEGNLLWAQSAGGPQNVHARSISLDVDRNIFITGSFAGSATFGSETVVSSGGGDVFLAKYSSSGTIQWVRSGGAGSMYRDESLAVTTDANGNAYITGYFTGAATFGSLPPITTAGWWDIFVAAYDSNGNELWATRAGGANSGWYGEAGRGIAVDDAGDVYVAGYFIGTASFGSIAVTAAGPSAWPLPGEMFLAKYNTTSSEWEWVVTGGGDGGDRATDLQIDGSGSLYVTGMFSDTATFGGTTLVNNPPGAGDYFVAKYHSDGTFGWAAQAGGTGRHQGHGIAVDVTGNVYLAATFSGTAEIGSTTLTSTGWDNVYVAKFDSSGTSEWAVHSPGNYYHVASGVAADPYGNVYAAGWFQGRAAFGQLDPLASPGTTDLFVARLGNFDLNPILDVHLDVRPGSCPNKVQVKSKGVLPTAILGTADFDVSLIDTSTLSIWRADGIGGTVGPLQTPPVVIDDVGTPFTGPAGGCHALGPDGVDDLLMKFSTEQLVQILEIDALPPNASVEIVIGGSLSDGTLISGSDWIIRK